MSASHIESGVQLFSRVNRKDSLDGLNSNLFPNGGPLPNQIIEITGDQKIDKGDLLIDFIVKCILPNEYNSEWKSSGAVLIICEHQINMFKIIKVIETHLKNNNVKDSRRDIFENVLKNLTIFNCYTPEDLQLAILNLERLIVVKDNINLIVIDNITAYYWIAKHENFNLSYYQHALKILQKLFDVIKNLNVVLIYVRNDKLNFVTGTKGLSNVNYRIDIQHDSNQKGCFKTVVTNFDQESSITVFYRSNITLQFFK